MKINSRSLDSCNCTCLDLLVKCFSASGYGRGDVAGEGMRDGCGDGCGDVWHCGAGDYGERGWGDGYGVLLKGIYDSRFVWGA